MAISVVQSTTVGDAFSGSFTSNVTAGNTVFLCIVTFSGTNVAISSSSPTFNGSPVTGATEVVSVQSPYDATSGVTVYSAIWMLPDLAGGAKSAGVTVTNGTLNSAVGLLLYEVSGLGAHPAADQSSTSSAGSSTAITSGATGNITHSPEFVLGVVASLAAFTSTGSPWTNQDISTSATAGYQIPASPGSSYTYSGTCDAADPWSAGVVTVSAGSGVTPVSYGAQRQAIRAKVPVAHVGGVYGSMTGNTGDTSFGSGRVMWSSGAPVNNPAPGPAFRQRVTPVRFIPPPPHPRAGRIGSSFGAVVQNPSHGPPVYAPHGPVRPRIPRPFAGSISARGQANGAISAAINGSGFGDGAGSIGAPVRNPSPGPVFRQAVSPARVRLTLPPRGRAASNPGAPVSPPAPPAPFTALLSSAPGMAWPGAATPGDPGPLQVPAPGPVLHPFTFPVRVHPVLPPRGRVASNRGGPVSNPPAPVAAPYPSRIIRARLQPIPRGRTASNAGAPVRNPIPGPVFRQATSPSRIRPSLPQRGRNAFNPGGPVRNPVIGQGPVFFPLRFPARARIPQDAPRGRVSSNRGTLASNPVQGPVFRQATAPVRARTPLPMRGRAGFNAGAPVQNPPPPGVSPVFQARQAVRARYLNQVYVLGNPGLIYVDSRDGTP